MKLVQVKEKDLVIMERLLQLYLHDISYCFPMEFDENTGLYAYDSLEKYFNNSNNYAYFLKTEDKIAGFMLIDSNEDKMIIQEMFVLNNYKNKGIGKSAVVEIFDKYKGNWVIKSLPCSEPAERFWDRTVRDYTNNNYTIERIGKYNRAVFSFNNSDK